VDECQDEVRSSSATETRTQPIPEAIDSGSPSKPPRARPKVIYIMGAGRSGSTILGVVLGNYEGCFYAGELQAWLRRSGSPNFGDPRRIEFWSGVRGDVQCDSDLFGDKALRYLEHSLAVFRMWNFPARRALRGRYLRTMEDLYRVLMSRAHATHVVDSSHFPLRARELQKANVVDLYLLYLVRDPTHVVESLGRRDVQSSSKSALGTNAYLWLTHLLATLVFLRHPREQRLLVRYEDFVSDPPGVLHCIQRHFGLRGDMPDLESLETGLPFQGNRLLHADVVSVQTAQLESKSGSYLTKMFQSPWRATQSLLAPQTSRRRPSEPLRGRNQPG
jgi:Sulfotransferase family